MEEILKILNTKCSVDNWKISDCFSHVKIAFLPKNATSKLPSLDAEIMKTFTVFYRKQLLQHVLVRIKPGSKASNVISIVDLLKFIGWAMDTWVKVKKETIANFFPKRGSNEPTVELFIDDDADFEFVGLQNYISEISPSSTVDCYLNQDESGVTSVIAVDIRSINWKEELREKAIRCVIQDDEATRKQAEANDNFDNEPPELKMRSSQSALPILDIPGQIFFIYFLHGFT